MVTPNSAAFDQWNKPLGVEFTKIPTTTDDDDNDHNNNNNNNNNNNTATSNAASSSSTEQPQASITPTTATPPFSQPYQQQHQQQQQQQQSSQPQPFQPPPQPIQPNEPTTNGVGAVTGGGLLPAPIAFDAPMVDGQKPIMRPMPPMPGAMPLTAWMTPGAAEDPAAATASAKQNVRVCFNCGQPNHVARACPLVAQGMSNTRHTLSLFLSGVVRVQQRNSPSSPPSCSSNARLSSSWNASNDATIHAGTYSCLHSLLLARQPARGSHRLVRYCAAACQSHVPTSPSPRHAGSLCGSSDAWSASWNALLRSYAAAPTPTPAPAPAWPTARHEWPRFFRSRSRNVRWIRSPCTTLGQERRAYQQPLS